MARIAELQAVARDAALEDLDLCKPVVWLSATTRTGNKIRVWVAMKSPESGKCNVFWIYSTREHTRVGEWTYKRVVKRLLESLAVLDADHRVTRDQVLAWIADASAKEEQ